MSAPIDESVIIARPPAEVFAFVADFENLPQFCATSAAVQKVSPGAIGRGTRFQQVLALYGLRMHAPIELVAFEQGRSLTYQAQAGPRVEGTCTFEAAPGGTHLRYTLKLHARGLYRLVAPLFVRILRQQTCSDLSKLKTLLEARAAA